MGEESSSSRQPLQKSYQWMLEFSIATAAPWDKCKAKVVINFLLWQMKKRTGLVTDFTQFHMLSISINACHLLNEPASVILRLLFFRWLMGFSSASIEGGRTDPLRGGKAAVGSGAVANNREDCGEFVTAKQRSKNLPHSSKTMARCGRWLVGYLWASHAKTVITCNIQEWMLSANCFQLFRISEQ